MDVANTLRGKHLLENSNLPFENKPHNSNAVFSFAIFRILHIVKRVLPPTITKNLLYRDFCLFCYDSDDKRANKYKPNIYQRWKHSSVYMLTLHYEDPLKELLTVALGSERENLARQWVH